MSRLITVTLGLLAAAGSTGCVAHKSGGQAKQTLPSAPQSTVGAPGILAAWSQLGPDGAWLARAVVNGATCPSLNVDGVTMSMMERGPTDTSFTALACEALVAPAAQTARIGSQSLPKPVAQPNHIVIMGDTGCKLKAVKPRDATNPGAEATANQSCNDGSDWPLAQVALSIAAEKPDLVLHVGDYHYREAPCPDGDTGCVGAVSGDNWESWREDFFEPMAPVMAATPLLLVRGNHELCARGGNGWFHYLDPRPMPSRCVDVTGLYWVPVGDHQVAVIDSAMDTNIQPSLDGMQVPAGALIWLALHRPFVMQGLDDEVTGAAAHLPTALAAPGAVAAVLAGHKHLFRLDYFSDGRPPELISGNGGTRLEKSPPEGAVLTPVTADAARGFEYYDYGYVTLDRQPGGWKLTAKDRNAKPMLACNVGEKLGTQTSMTCAATP